MTCLEVQSKIIAYIDNKLEKDDKTEFLKHMQYCENCKEELDIYYTMIEGMRQLDSDIPLSRDFREELDQRMARELRHDRKQKKLIRSSVGLILLGAIGVVGVAYLNFQKFLLEEEQRTLKEAQGAFYYSDTFDELLFRQNTEEQVFNINVESTEDTKEETDFYNRVRQYNALSQLK